jgi:hypothetical protein
VETVVCHGDRGRDRRDLDTDSREPARRAQLGRAIAAIKLVHSAIFLLNSAAILHIFVVGVRDRPSRWTGAALAVAFTEVLVFVGNRGRCPLTDLVEHLGAESGRVSDIFLPRWFADRIPQLCGPLLLAGVLALLWHHWPAAHNDRAEHQR